MRETVLIAAPRLSGICWYGQLVKAPGAKSENRTSRRAYSLAWLGQARKPTVWHEQIGANPSTVSFIVGCILRSGEREVRFIT